MGHVDPAMAGHHLEGIDDERLVAVTEHIRKWLLAAQKEIEQSPTVTDAPN